MNWHTASPDQLFSITGSSQHGLTGPVANVRLTEYGTNDIQEKPPKPVWQILLGQFQDIMILILMGAAVISGILGDLADTIIILVIVVLNAVIGFFQEYRAEKAMDALKKMATLHARVWRDRELKTVPSSELVPGDVVLLEAGNAVPADVRLFETYQLRVDESALTGESVPVDKSNRLLTAPDLPLGDRINMAYKSTLVTNGRATGLVVATGMNTEIGAIARLLQSQETATPLQLRMADFGKKLSYVVLGICLFLFVGGLLRGENVFQMLLLSISLAVAAIPEALPALITVALSKGANRLVAKNALVRKLPAVETLGSVTYICSDKTGTLTQNKMKVVWAEPAGELPVFSNKFSLFDIAIALNHDVKSGADGHTHGDPTEIALVQYFTAHNPGATPTEIEAIYPRTAELPFDSDRKCMTTIHPCNGGWLVLSKGATESVADLLAPGTEVAPLLEKAHRKAEEGLRVLAYAYKLLDTLPETLQHGDIEQDLHFLGMVGMIDPPRAGIEKSIQVCKSAGIQPVMITGDHPATAAAIARQIGIVTGENQVITGAQLQNLTASEFEARVEHLRVYARVSPEQKLNIVRALQSKNHFVAMTGDGVNDAPSLKTANIGIAMGITGTDVSKESAHMILLDDNFATIVGAVKEGRRIYDNIRKFVKYIMTCNSAEIWTIAMAPLLGLPIPLLPIHILWINLVTDGLPGLALAGEKAERDIMKRPPRDPKESLFADGIGAHIVWVGLLMAACTLGMQVWGLKYDAAYWQTMVFNVLSLSQLGHVWAIRSERTFIYKEGLLSNKLLFYTVVLTFGLQMLVIYHPLGNALLHTTPLPLPALLISLGVSAVVFHAVELEKWVRYMRRAV